MDDEPKPGLELTLPEPEPEPEPESEPKALSADEDDGAGVGLPKRDTSMVDVGIEGSTPKEVRVFTAVDEPQVALPGEDDLEDLDPQHAQMFQALLDVATDANAGPRFAAELAFDQFCQTQFGVGVLGPIAQNMAAWLVLPLDRQSASRRFEILKLMEQILDGAGAKAFSSALRRHALVALEAIEGFHHTAEQTAERQGSDTALGIPAVDHEVCHHVHHEPLPLDTCTNCYAVACSEYATWRTAYSSGLQGCGNVNSSSTLHSGDCLRERLLGMKPAHCQTSGEFLPRLVVAHVIDNVSLCWHRSQDAAAPWPNTHQ